MQLAEINPLTYKSSLPECTAVLDDSAIDDTVRQIDMAFLTETPLIRETRKFLQTDGVVPEGFSMGNFVDDFICQSIGRSYGNVQAECLSLLLWAVKHSRHLNEEFTEMEGYDMLFTLLCSPKVDVRLPLIKVRS